jgi:peroxiredoxin Q/BCP
VVEEGKPAPDFELTTDSGDTVRLADLRGKQVVLYFYPRDDTPGCTKQACGIRDAWDAFRETGAQVFGVSSDGEESHAKFRQKHGLPFTLLADPGHELTERYGFWVQKSFAGKKYMGVERSTVVIGPDGVVEKVFRRVKPAGHAAQVLDALDSS